MRMRISNSLSWAPLNAFIDLYCWKRKTHKMSSREEMNVYMNINYIQC